MRKMTRNIVMCNECDDVIESRSRHDFKGCVCGSVFIDGGLDYQRVGYGNLGYTDMSEYEEVEE